MSREAWLLAAALLAAGIFIAVMAVMDARKAKELESGPFGPATKGEEPIPPSSEAGGFDARQKKD